MTRTVRRILVVIGAMLGLASITIPAHAGLVLNNHCEPLPAPSGTAR